VPFAAAFAGAQRLRPDAPAAAVGAVNLAATIVILVGTPLVGLSFSLPGDGRIGFLVCGVLFAAAAFAVRTPKGRVSGTVPGTCPRGRPRDLAVADESAPG
jgi:hypothetical protein